MNKDEAKKKFPTYQPDPLTYHLPDAVKDPKNYFKIEKALLDTLKCKKDHSDPLEMAGCSTCTKNMLARRSLLKKFGFYSSAQYMRWKKIMNEMINPKRDPIKGTRWNK